MKLLIVGMNYAPELTGIGKYTGEMAEWFAGQGHDVRVVAAPPYYPNWKVHAGYSPLVFRREIKSGVYVFRCPVYVPSKPNGIRRILHLFSFALSSLPLMLRHILWRPDVVVAIEPPLFCAPAAWLTARMSAARCWLHVQDFEVDAAFALGLLSSPRIRKSVLAIESWWLHRFDRVSTISTSMLRKLGEKGVQSERLVMFPNWSDLETVRPDREGASRFRRQHGIPAGSFVALYSGNMGEKQGLELVLDAAEQLRHDENMLFILCGEGSARKQLMNRAHGLGNVRFLDLQPPNLLSAMLSAADVHLVIQKESAADLVMPSKLTNIMAVGGTSIVTAAEESELGRLFGEHPILGERCLPGDLDDLVHGIVACRGRSTGHASSRIREYAEQYLDKQSVLERVETECVSLTTGRRNG